MWIWKNYAILQQVNIKPETVTDTDPSQNVCLNPCDNDPFNTLRPRQNGQHFPDDIFKCIFLNENVLISP